MATKKQQEELIQTLKFTPRSYNIHIGGYGGEAYAGTVDPAVYEHFKQNKIDIEQYATDWDDKFDDVPRDLRPYNSGSPYDCDNLFHASGAELSNLNEIQIRDEAGNEHWTCAAGINELEDAGVEVNNGGGCNFDDLPEDSIVHWGGQGEKGTFFDCDFELTQPFDPKKLTVTYENCDGWWIISSVEYNGESIEGTDGYSTTGKWTENKWILCNGNEVYESVTREDEDEDDNADDDEDIHETGTDNAIDFPAVALTDWYPVAVKPVRKGEYDVDLGKDIAWPFASIVRAEWSGRVWKNPDGKSIKNIVAWRGLTIDPLELA